MQTGPKRTIEQRSADRAAIAQMWLRCMTQAEIAAQSAEGKLPSRQTLTQQTISNEIKAIEREWKTHALTDFDQAKRREYEKLNLVERDAWQGWERSKADLKSKKRRLARAMVKARTKRQRKAKTKWARRGFWRF